MSSLSWLGKTLCPPDCLVKRNIKAPSCAAIFQLGIVVLQCVRAGEVFCGLHVTHIRIICPVRDVTHVRKCTRPSPTLPYCKRREAGRGPGNEASDTTCTVQPYCSALLSLLALSLAQYCFSNGDQVGFLTEKTLAHLIEKKVAIFSPDYTINSLQPQTTHPC